MKARNVKLILLLALGLVISSITLGPITNDFLINDDTRIIYPVHQFQDSDLFKNDIMSEYTQNAQAPVTTALLQFYGFANNYLDFILVGKLLAILLFSIAIIYAYKLGEVIDKKTAFIFGLLVTLQMGATFYYFSGGLSRAFAWPFVLAFMYYLLRDSKVKLSIVLILQALFYAPVFIICFGTYFLLNLSKHKLDIKKYKTLFLSAIAPFSILVLSFANKKNFGQMTNIFEAISMPEYYTGGRVPTFRGEIPFTNSLQDILYSIFNYHNTGISNPVYLSSFVVFGAIGLIFLVYYREKLLPKELHYMALASMLLFVTAFLLFFYLYFPARYIGFTMPIFIFAAVSVGFGKISSKITSEKARAIFLSSIIILAIIFFAPKIGAAYTICEDEALYDTIAALDKDAIIAGHPEELDCIPIFTKHTVIFMDELTAPYHKDYYITIKSRINNFFSAYYSADFSDIQNFCRKYGLSYVIVNREHYTSDFISGKVYREPFNTEIKVDLQDREDFALDNYDGDDIIFENGVKYLLKC